MKKIKCIRDYSECTDSKIDISTGRLFATSFRKTFAKGKEYMLLKSNNIETIIQNEFGDTTNFDTPVLSNYFKCV